MRILLAEDEKDLNKIITARLKDEYYSVDSCFDGKEAEEYLTAVKYDAVILDIMMPKKDGLSVLKEMRRKKDSTPPQHWGPWTPEAGKRVFRRVQM